MDLTLHHSQGVICTVPFVLSLQIETVKHGSESLGFVCLIGIVEPNHNPIVQVQHSEQTLLISQEYPFKQNYRVNVAQKLSTDRLWRIRQPSAKLSVMSKQTIQELRENLATNLRELRAAKGYAQDSLALDSGVHRTMLSKIERSLTNPSLDTLVKLANTLDVSVSELLKDKN